jgi:regulator of RNase E activity RraA
MRDPDTTIALIEHLVPRLPSGSRFIVDAVQGCASSPWTVEDAIRVGHVCARFGARWYEEPCRAENVAGYAAVRQAVDVPISGVESHGTVENFRELISAGGVDVAQPDVSLVGGPAAFTKVADLAAEAGIIAVPHVWGTATAQGRAGDRPRDARFGCCAHPRTGTPLRLRTRQRPCHRHACGMSTITDEQAQPHPHDERDGLLTSPILSDALDAVGRRGQVLAPGICPLQTGSRAFGRAATLQFAPTATDQTDPYEESIAFIDALTPGTFVIVATGGSIRSAFWGELFSAAAQGHGAVGVACDGPVRDTPKIIGLGFPVFAPCRHPLDYRARMRVVARNRPVVVAGVIVTPGDLVFADDDGIVVIPRDVEAEVLVRARDRASAESTVLAELLSGDSLRAVWQRHGIL